MSPNAIKRDNEVVRSVQSAASEFVDELDQGQCESDDWSDAEITDTVVTRSMNRLLQRLSDTRLLGKANQLASSEVWRIAGHVLKHGDLQNHARTKPRGYAGDYQMLHKICRQTICEHPLGRAFDRFFQDQDAPQAVRNRTQLTADRITAHVNRLESKRPKIVSIGSGSAEDIIQAIKQTPVKSRKEVDVILLDLDADALDFARQQLEPLLPIESVYCLRTNLYRIPRNKKTLNLLQNADFLICAGLFDYLNQADAADMLASFWNSLSDTGKLMVFNFAPGNPSRTYMEWIGNWYLLYRSRDEMLELTEHASLPKDQFVVGAEELKLNQCVEAWR